MANVLVVSDYFKGGGLETQICSQVRSLAVDNYTFYLATSSDPSLLAHHTFKDGIFNLPMLSATPSQLLETVNKITKFVEENDINVIHAHPFTSLIIGMAVAHITSTYFIGTLHGPTSLFSAAETTSGLLLNKAFFHRDNTLISVSPETSLLAKAIASCNPIILPNAVSIPLLVSSNIHTHKPWAWYGRIDSDKIIGLIHLITFIIESKLSPLHIYGDGPAKDELLNKINELDSGNEYITHHGWVDNINDTFSNYSVIAGMGRVILEAAAYNKICLLVGYDGVKTFLTPDVANKVSFWNFSGRGIKSQQIEGFVNQWYQVLNNPLNYSLFDWVKEKHNEEGVWKKYKEILNNKKIFRENIFNDFINVLHYLGDCETPFWENHEGFLLLKKISQHQD